jgi:hypothetical protein
MNRNHVQLELLLGLGLGAVRVPTAIYIRGNP